MIFARDLNDNLASLVKKIDAATSKNKSARMGSFVVFLNDEEGFDEKLKAFAEKHKLSSCALSIDSPAGPKAYKIAKDANVNVMLYNRKRVAANYAFRKGEFDAKNVETIVSDLKKILPE